MSIIQTFINKPTFAATPFNPFPRQGGRDKSKSETFLLMMSALGTVESSHPGWGWQLRIHLGDEAELLEPDSGFAITRGAVITPG